ncbi:hypothetical protein [Holospora elegans]|uniref:hypothetical protein n=1 Tax=Holospora elegans TaxID=431043 RepID=UPI00139249C8|nr:hypothetical protein [Holospora elegans]
MQILKKNSAKTLKALTVRGKKNKIFLIEKKIYSLDVFKGLERKLPHFTHSNGFVECYEKKAPEKNF